MAWLKKKPKTTEQPKEIQQIRVESPVPIRTEPIRVEPRQQMKPKERWQVVKEIPLQPIREFREEDGTIVHLITLEEALTLQMNE